MGRVLIRFLLFVIICDKPFISVVITWSLLFKLSMFSCLSAQNLLTDAKMGEDVVKGFGGGNEATSDISKL